MLSISPSDVTATAAPIVADDAFASHGRRRPAPIVRVVKPRIDDEMLADIQDSEREFYCEARQKVQKLADARKKAAERRKRDARNIEALANAALELADFDQEALCNVKIVDVAAAAKVSLSQARRLRKDAYWLARDYAETDALGIERNETEYERDLRIATDALTSSDAVQARKGKIKPYTARHARLVSENTKREEYLRRMSDEPRAQSHIIAGYDEDGVVTVRHQSARDRFDVGGRGFVSKRGWVGGASTQENGGTCYQGVYVEKGKRSSESVLDQRFLALTPKAPGKRRKGISHKTTIQRIIYLDGIGKATEEIAADVNEKVGRVKGVLHAARYDNRHWAGDNNDRRCVHLQKWVALDQIHGNTRTDCREIIRVDKDHIFESWKELEDYLNTLKVRPQQVVYVRDDMFPERVTKPHLLYYLPAGRGVWYNEGTGMAMLEGAAAALTLDAGGDIGGLANIGDCKQPISPRTVRVNIETEYLPTLSELCQILDVDLKNNLVVTMCQQSVAQMMVAGVSEAQSGAFYTLAGKRGFELCHLWERVKELRVDLDLDRRHLGVELGDALLEDRWSTI